MTTEPDLRPVPVPPASYVFSMERHYLLLLALTVYRCPVGARTLRRLGYRPDGYPSLSVCCGSTRWLLLTVPVMVALLLTPRDRLRSVSRARERRRRRGGWSSPFSVYGLDPAHHREHLAAAVQPGFRAGPSSTVWAVAVPTDGSIRP
jgi:hypothetical protein